MDRRSFIKNIAVTGVVVAATGVTGCSNVATSESSSGNLGATNASTSASAESSLLTADSLDQQWSFEIAPDPIDDSQITQTYRADIVVVGGGMSGMCTACRATELGADVTVVTASSVAISRGGSNNGIGTDYQKSLGIDVSPESIRHALQTNKTAASYSIDERKWAKWINNSAESVNWMIKVMEANGLNVCLENGYEDPDDVLSFPTSSHNFWTADQPNGAIFGAPMQAQAYAAQIEKNGGTIYYNTVAEQLIRDDDNTGRVSAVIAKDANENYVKFEANKAVVLATGDFSKDKDMMARYAPSTYKIFKDAITWDKIDYDATLVYEGLFPGAGHKMGLWIGAGWQHAYPCAPMVGCISGAPQAEGSNNPWCINLASDGRRFMNENTNFAYTARELMQRPDMKIFYIWDADYANVRDAWPKSGACVNGVNGITSLSPSEQLDTWNANAESGACMKGNTLQELLAQFPDLDTDAALGSIDRWNTYCANGYDEEFHDNPGIMRPIATAPFFGVEATQKSLGFLTICGGLRTNEDMQVCQDDDTPIEGLYCTGIMTGDFYSNQYNFGIFGQNLGGVCCTLSYMLADDLVKL